MVNVHDVSLRQQALLDMGTALPHQCVAPHVHAAALQQWATLGTHDPLPRRGVRQDAQLRRTTAPGVHGVVPTVLDAQPHRWVGPGVLDTQPHQ